MSQRSPAASSPAAAAGDVLAIARVEILGPDGMRIDVGTVRARQGRLEFAGRRGSSEFAAVRQIAVGREPWIRVDYGTRDGLATVYLRKSVLGPPGRALAANRRLASDLRAAVRPAGLSDAGMSEAGLWEAGLSEAGAAWSPAGPRAGDVGPAAFARRWAVLGMWLSGFLAVVGAVGMLASYDAARPGARYVIATAALVVGVVFFAVSVLEHRRARREVGPRRRETGRDRRTGGRG